MSLERICSREVIVAKTGESIRQAAERMRAKKVGALAVVDEHHHPVGIFTDRDITTRVVAPGKDPSTVTVGEVMTKDPLALEDSVGIEDALQKLYAQGLRRALIVNDTGRLCGIVSLDDILELLADEMTTIGRLLSQQDPGSHRGHSTGA